MVLLAETSPRSFLRQGGREDGYIAFSLACRRACRTGRPPFVYRVRPRPRTRVQWAVQPGHHRPIHRIFKSMDHLSPSNSAPAKARAALLAGAVCAAAALVAGCGGGKQAGPGGPPAMPVEVVTLAEQ